MLKLTTMQLINAGPVMRQLVRQKTTGLAALRIMRLVAKLNPELRAAEEARNTLATPENSVEIEGGLRQIRPACLAAFLASPLFTENLDIDALPLRPADIAEAHLSVEDLELLGPLFVDDGQ
jgi:hypothetical protein